MTTNNYLSPYNPYLGWTWKLTVVCVLIAAALIIGEWLFG